MFAQTSANHTPITPFVILSSVESTNNYAMAKLHACLVQQGVCFLALEQSAGRGQRGKQWLSAPGENITLSAVFQPSRSLSSKITAFPFLFSASMALGCYDFIKAYGFQDVTIKWPNDIYIGDRKAAGILIENLKHANSWIWAVTGVGVNINQRHFSAASGKPVSFSLVTGRQYDVILLGRQLHQHLLKRYYELANSSPPVLADYNAVLYKKNQSVKLKKNNVLFSATISHVNESGELVTAGPIEQTFTYGDIEFI